MSEPDDDLPDSQQPASTAQSVVEVLAGDSLPDEAVLRRADAKPPLYRFFRGGMYVSYLLVTVWLCGAIVLAAWNAVWGEPGKALAAKEGQAQPLQLTPNSSNNP